MKRAVIMITISAFSLAFLSFCNNRPKEMSDDELFKKAIGICKNNIILDSHIDWPEFLIDDPEDISRRTVKGDFDLERAEKGGLNAVLSVAYVSSALDVEQGRIMADSMLNLIDYYVETYPDKFALSTTPADIRKNFEKGLLSLVPCLENAAPAGNDTEYFKYLKGKGVAYVTLCHNRVNQICDSNFDPERKWKGLSPYGIEVIRILNRLGIMVDISHSTDSTVFQALRYSSAPIVATHSSCRYFVPGYERNLSDTLIKAIAAKNGVVMVNFGSMFLDSVCMRNLGEAQNILKKRGSSIYTEEGMNFFREFSLTHKVQSDSKRLVDHIDHIVKIAGIDHVGLGSDFDGIGPTQPVDVPDVSCYPVIVCELLRRGYSEDDIRKILSGNFLRVWDEVLSIGEAGNRIQER